MFRQVRTAETIPFTPHAVGGAEVTGGAGVTDGTALMINAVDYDLGRQGAAYYDRDTASYQYTPGVKTVGNRGRAYRNDGVDIMKAGLAPFQYVFGIEDGEWLQYTVQVAKEGRYTVGFTVSAAAGTGMISMTSNGKWLIRGLGVPATGEADSTGYVYGPGAKSGWQRIESQSFILKAGTNVLRVYADKGGWNFASLVIVRVP